ncbi:pyridoxal phosphate-dependent transferase [Hyaloraphidium curvatum]|nr:pyridoxal phosphate-dependent transferase [Hyaloraphidium curvatum]
MSLPRPNNPLWAARPDKLRTPAASPRLPGSQSHRSLCGCGVADDATDHSHDEGSAISDETLAVPCCFFDGVSSRAACNLEGCFLLGEGMAKVAACPFDPVTKSGIVNVGSAENRLMVPEILEKLNSMELKFTKDMLGYGSYHGSLALRTSVANFVNRHFACAEPLNPIHVAAFAGCASTLSALFQVIADPGDGVLLAGPFFGGFDQHLRLASRARPVIVQMDPDDGFKVSVPRLERALDRELERGLPVRALLLCNPNNPLAFVHTREELIEIMEFCARRNLHLVVDEIYACSSFGAPFTSSLAIRPEEVPGGFSPNRLHVVWGLSKDFAMNGFRAGFAITRAPRVIAALHRIAFFHNFQAPMDNLIARLLADDAWCDGFLRANNAKLHETYSRLSEWMDERGWTYLRAGGGFYVFVDFSRWVRKLGWQPPEAGSPADEEEEEEDAAAGDRTAERQLWHRFLDAGVYMAPGEGFGVPATQLGWFRLVFALDWAELELALERMQGVLDAIDKESK